MIYNWRLSPVEPFAWETQRYAGPAQFPLLDMHKSIHLVTLSDGELSGNIGGGGFEFHAGDFYLTSPWEIHGAISSRKGFELLLLTVNPDVLFSSLLYGRERLLEFFLMKPEARMKLLLRQEISRSHAVLCRKLEQLQKKSGPYMKSKQWLAIEGFFVNLLECLDDRGLNAEPNIGAVYNKLQPALRKLFLSTEQLTLRDAAGECCLSIDYFSHLFKQCFGISFAAYELNYRLNQAADCMLKKRHSLKEVARIYGFSDKSHFCRSFKKNFGITPGRFSRENAV